MSSQKKIEINQSSLLGLKAELLRKKNEVSTAKYSQQLSNTKVIKKKLTTKFDKANEGVSERDQRDAEDIQQESDELKKSQRILEEKAKLYERLTNKCLGGNSDVDSSNFLVNFKQKANEESVESKEVETVEEKEPETVESDYGEFSEDEEEWVDFVDCLGRTKRCHRDDLQAMKEQDAKLKASLFGDTRKDEAKEKEKEREKEAESIAGVQLPQLCSEDMKREILRQKWEEQERNLLDKKNVHYQDVLFDEARTHGVGYYEFSTDEVERARQQEELKKLRKETEEQQAETQTIAQKKQKQMEERLKAARRRKRERLGLPPEDEPEVPEVKVEEDKKPEPVEELRRDVRKPAPIRPWDIGKEGTTNRVLSQEEWVEKKRAERPEEFAPPTFPNKRKFQKRMKEESPPPTLPKRTYMTMEPVPIEDELEERETRRRGAEIPPPPTFDMYGPSSVRRRNTGGNLSQAEIDRSIEEGLEFLKRKAEEKKARRPVDETDIM